MKCKCFYENFLFLVIMAVFTTGCTSLRTLDDLPPGAPKGYVEFYILQNEGIGFLPFVTGTGFNRIMIPDHVLENKLRLRIARSPGISKFLVQIGGSISGPHEFVDVLVEKDMIVPVKINFTDVDIKVSHDGSTTTRKANFNMNLIIEKAIPFEK
jgi:hypothetical protein